MIKGRKRLKNFWEIDFLAFFIIFIRNNHFREQKKYIQC